MLWLPVLRLLVLKLALPFVKDKTSKDVCPSSKLTVPVGVFELTTAGVTVAVKVTCSPNTEGLGNDFTAATDSAPAAIFTTYASRKPV